MNRKHNSLSSVESRYKHLKEKKNPTEWNWNLSCKYTLFQPQMNGANTFQVDRKTAQFEPNQKVLEATDKHGVTS